MLIRRGIVTAKHVRCFAFLVVYVVFSFLIMEVIYNVQASLNTFSTIKNYLKAQTQLWTVTLD